MKRLITPVLLLLTTAIYAQKTDGIITAAEASRIENVLASDEMRGRKTFSPEIEKAADFIAAEFKKAGLQPWKAGAGYRQEFAMSSAKQTSLSAKIDGREIPGTQVVVITFREKLVVTPMSGYEKAEIKAGQSIFQEAMNYTRSGKNMLVLVDTSFARNFSRLSRLKSGAFETNGTVIFLLGTAFPETYTFEAEHTITKQSLSNVVGILPGKSRKDEYVIFSAHYDHIGVGKPVNGDSIYNGANDDAAGTTAVILLARYFKALNNNERTIVFAAFTAEEVGGFGASFFSQQYDPAKVMAMFNIEMIGTESKWGRNSAYITGYDKTDMGTILQKNLAGTGFTFHPDPYPEQQLFYRSDNATLARLGVPAHTISTAKMDQEPHYHKPSDHPETLDMDNMAKIIESIALSSRGIIAGKETPSRVNTKDLR
ncbi:MAG: M28 family peptidase [Chitinophagaceae bacterium]